MAKSTGPILAVGAITLGNQVLFHDKPLDWRIPLATGAAAAMLAFLEKPMGDVPAALAWLALGVVIFTRTNPAVPAPVETAFEWWNTGR